MYGKRAHDGKPTNESCIEGVIGVIFDVTELKEREEAIENNPERSAAPWPARQLPKRQTG